MSENKNPMFQTIEDASQYVEDVRALYRAEEGQYRGARTDEQKLIAEVVSEEAKMMVDGVLLGMMAVAGSSEDEIVTDQDAPLRGGYSWSDFRSEFQRLLVGFGVLTNRLHRDVGTVPEYSGLSGPDSVKVASVLLSDFLSHNALRFGVDTAGVHAVEVKRVHTDDGGVEMIRRPYDKDKAATDKVIERNMKARGYRTGVAAHPAGKISPDEYISLRREFPEIEKDDFDRDVSFYTNVRTQLENQE